MATECCRTRFYGMVCAAHGNHTAWMCLDCGQLVGHGDQVPVMVQQILR